MIAPGLYLGFIAAVTLLMLTPGPNMSLLVANSMSYGARYGFVTLAGTCSAAVVQLALTTLGMTQLLASVGIWFNWLRWAGVIYLICLGIQQWRATPTDLTKTAPQPKSVRTLFLRGFLVSMTNPKTLLFYGAFLPQFITLSHPVMPQMVLLSATVVAIILLVDGGWVALAARARRLLLAHGRLRNRLSGGFLIGAGAALSLVRAK